MDLQKIILSRAVNWTCFAVENNLKLLSVAGDDGTILIFSQDDILIYEDKKDNIRQLQFLSKRGSLIGFGNEPGLHMWNINEATELFAYKFIDLDLNLEVKITSICEFQRMDSNETSDNNCNIIIGYSNGTIELCDIDENRIMRSNAAQLNNFNGIINQLLEISYENEILVLLLLVNESIMKIECFVSWKVDSDSELFSIFLQINQTISIFRTEYRINHFEVINNQLIISTETGKYGIFNLIETLLENKIELNCNILEFPYGPFPCKPIYKCLETTFSGIKGKCFVFSGGLPEVTYKDLNAVSVAVNHEPEICFTFNDTVMDFTVITHNSNDINEIVVLTKTEYISITYQNGMWNSCYKNQIRPISQNQITGMSNPIEIKNFLIDQNSNESADKRFEQIKRSKSVKLFALSNDDNTVSTWIITPDHFFLHETVNLNQFYKESEIQKLEKIAPWPKFVKCGNWKSYVREIICVEFMKIFCESNGQMNLLISTNRNSIFLFKICLRFDGKVINKSQYKQWSHHHVSINDSTTDNVSTINNSANNSLDDLYLIALITFNEKIDPLILDFNINQDIISFAGSFGIGCIEINTGKHLFLPLCVFKIGERIGQFSDLIEKNIRKRKLIEYPLAKIKFEENFTSNVFKPQSMMLWQIDDKKFGIFIGFANGSMLNINFVLDENLDFCVENMFRRLFTNTIHKIISIQLIEIETQFVETHKYRTLNQLNFDNSFETINQTSENSIDTTASLEIKSIYTTNGNIFLKDIMSRRSLRIKSRSKPVKKKTFLLRAEQYSVKIIEYPKMKTRFKFKINCFINNSAVNNSKKQTKSIDTSETIISESRIFKRDRIFTKWFCFILLSNKSVIELSVPNLIPLKTINFHLLDFEYKLISIDFDIMLMSENKTTCSQLTLFGNNDYRKCRPLLECKIDKNKCQNENDENVINNDTSILDFMKEAKKSLYSLCGEN